MMVMMNWKRSPSPRDAFWPSIARLLGHILGSACIFVFLFTVEWGLTCFSAGLNSIRPMDPDDLQVVHHVGKAFLIGDVTLSGIVFMTGFVKFVHELWS